MRLLWDVVHRLVIQLAQHLTCAALQARHPFRQTDQTASHKVPGQELSMTRAQTAPWQDTLTAATISNPPCSPRVATT